MAPLFVFFFGFSIFTTIAVCLALLLLVVVKVPRVRDAISEPVPELAAVTDAGVTIGTANDELMNSISALMEESQLYLDKSLTLDTLTMLVASNRTYVSKCINTCTGKSFSDYLNEYRVNYAKTLMEWYGSEASLEQIGSESGYTSESTFIRNFKKITGSLPSEWRKSLKR